MNRGRVLNNYLGCHTCLICGQDVGSKDLTDGVFMWPDGLSHYIHVHSVRPRERFIHHALGKKGMLFDG